jgi:hypothetical protein
MIASSSLTLKPSHSGYSRCVEARAKQSLMPGLSSRNNMASKIVALAAAKVARNMGEALMRALRSSNEPELDIKII